MILLSAAQASAMLKGLEAGNLSRASLDLGLSETAVVVEGGLVRLSETVSVSPEDLRRIAGCDDSIFTVSAAADGAVVGAGGARVEKLIRYSEATRRTYKLRPTADWPALEISGILMHRIKGITPRLDAEAKLDQVAPVLGAVLETCMGLGYTAMLAAKTAGSVTAIEKDPNVVEMARLNPWSQPLFENPRIELLAGDSAELVAGFADRSFGIVNHDPPTVSVAGELYSDVFYAELLRILRPGGKLLHYTGAPGSRGRGVDLGASVARRLQRIGFARVRSGGPTGCVVAERPGR